MKQLEEQALLVIKALEEKQYPQTSPILNQALDWISRWPRSLDLQLRERLMEAICKSFSLSKAEIYRKLEGLGEIELEEEDTPPDKTNEQELREIIPAGSWLEKYYTLTKHTESPLSYHLFSGLSAVGCALNRKVYLKMGFFNVYPNMAVLLIGPTGRVRKTSATDVAMGIIKELQLCSIAPDKPTPEALGTALVEDSTQFIWAPEFVVFFGKQQYNEGLVNMVIRLLDAPSEYKVRTQARGEEFVQEPTIHFLGASTMSLLTSAAPQQVLDSGFLNRFCLVVEDDTERIFPMPAEGPNRKEVVQRVKEIHQAKGAATLSPAAEAIHVDWYYDFKKVIRSADETVASMIERAQIHMLRMAINIHLIDCGTLEICPRCIETAIKLHKFLQKSLPTVARAIQRTAVAQDTDYVVRQLTNLGGAADHSSLLRRVSSRMGSRQLRQVITTLEESGIVKVGARGAAQYYILQGQGAY